MVLLIQNVVIVIWLEQLTTPIFNTISNINFQWDSTYGCLINEIAQTTILIGLTLTDAIFDVESPSLGGGGTTGGGSITGGTTTTAGETEFKCWWCPPIEYMTTICNTIELSGLYTDVQWIAIANNFGCSCSTPEAATTFLDAQVFQNTFDEGCIYVINSGGYTKILRDVECCTLIGGNWNSSINLCYTGEVQIGCQGKNLLANYNPTIAVSFDNGVYTNLSSECCLNSGGYYSGDFSGGFLFDYSTHTITSGFTQTTYYDSNLIIDALSLFGIELLNIPLQAQYPGMMIDYCSPCPFEMVVIGNDFLTQIRSHCQKNVVYPFIIWGHLIHQVPHIMGV